MSEHDEDHHHPAPLSPVEVRARALEELLVAKGLVQADVIDTIVGAYEHDIGPMNGARVVARAWVDPAYRARLLADGTAAIAELGFGGPEGERIVVVENTPTVHNVVVCTLCSCYPWPVLGLPPNWYKDAPYRSRVVREPRALLGEMGCDVPEHVEIRVWDSSAETRYMVLPERPADSVGLDEDALTARVSRDAIDRYGAAVSDTLDPAVTAMGGPAALPRRNGELVFDAPWQGRVFGLALVIVERLGVPWAAFQKHLIAAIAAHPEAPYYDCWVAALEQLLMEHGTVSDTELGSAATRVRDAAE